MDPQAVKAVRIKTGVLKRYDLAYAQISERLRVLPG